MLLGKFFGLLGSSPKFRVFPGTYSDIVSFPSSASVSLAFKSNGDVELITGVGTTQVGKWVIPTGLAGAGYEIRATLNSGSFGTGTMGSWLGLGSNRTWANSQSGSGVTTGNATFEIRNAASLAVVASGSITLTANVL